MEDALETISRRRVISALNVEIRSRARRDLIEAGSPKSAGTNGSRCRTASWPVSCPPGIRPLRTTLPPRVGILGTSRPRSSLLFGTSGDLAQKLFDKLKRFFAQIRSS